MHMGKYIQFLLVPFGLTEATIKGTPFNASRSLEKLTKPADGVDVTLFQQIVGALLHLARYGRPDISWVVSNLARHLTAPGKAHMEAALRVLRYLKGTQHLAMFCAMIYSDSDWATDAMTRRSTTGFIVLLNGLPMIFYSRKQKSVALSSCEAEIFAMSQGIRMVIWMKAVFEELIIKTDKHRYTVFGDSKSAIDLLNSDSGSSPQKHIDIRIKYIKEMVTNGTLVLEHVATEDSYADVFTKAVSIDVLQLFLAGVMRSVPMEGDGK